MIVAGALSGSADTMGTGCGGGACYAAMALIYIFPGWLLIRSASTLRAHAADPREQVMEVLDLRARFWRIIGITFGLFAILYLGVIAITATTSLNDNLRETFEAIEP